MLKSIVLVNKWLVLAGLMFCADMVFAQTDINFTGLTTKNGLSSNTINAILQDHNGLIWFGTSDGLNKFDGTNVTVYTHDERDSTSLPANEVISLLEDRSGKLWVGTNGGGLTYYDQQHNSFVAYRGDGSIQKNSPATARTFYEDHAGNIWVGSYEAFRIIDPSSNKVTTIDINRMVTGSVNVAVALAFFEDKAGRMWIGTNGGLLLFDRQKNKFTTFVHHDDDPASLSGNEVRCITQDTNGHLFFGTNNGLSMLLPGEKTFRAFHHSDQEPASISSDLIYDAAVAPGGKLWIGTEDGVNIFDTNNFTVAAIRPNRRKSFSLTNKSVRCIWLAKKGIIWLGTYRGGVNKYDPNLALFNLEKSAGFDPKGLASPVVTAFAELKKEEIFIGTDAGGLHLFHRNTGLFDHLDIKSKIDHSGNPLTILALELDAQKKLWIGTYQNGLFVYDPSSGHYQQYLAGNTIHELVQNDIFVIKQDSKGLIWIGTNGHGVNIFDPKTQTFSNYSNHPANKNDLILPLNGFMRAITEDKSGNVWLGSSGTGIAVFNRNERNFTVYNKANSKLTDDAVFSILHDRAGNTWVGTGAGGLNLFDKSTRQFSHLNETNGLPNGIIYKILEDKAGLIWLTTDKGISSVDPKTRTVKNFSRANGVQDSPFVLGSGISASDGELYFGGQDGFNYFSPGALPTNNITPPVLLTELKVANNSVTPRENAPIKEQIGTAKDIYLSYGQNFSIGYVALNYTAPQQSNYSYKLNGFDPDWNFVGKGKTAYYTNIDPGDYVFQVRASNNDGVWNPTITTIRVHVLPPFWRTVYAYIMYVLLFFGILFYIRSRGIQKIKNELALRQEKINAQLLIAEQRREAARLHELDMQKIRFLTNLSHEFRTPISLILAPVDKLIAQPKDPAIGGQLNMIRRNARRLLNLVNQLLDLRTMEEKELKLNLAAGDLVVFIKETAESFQDLSERKKIALHVASEVPNLPAVFDHDKIERIIFNLLSNAFKFTHEGGEIKLSLSVENDHPGQPATFCAAVADTGIGINPSVKDRIFERFFMEDNGAALLNQGSGIGLSITKEFVHLHGGEIGVESQPGHGTTFYITLPVVEPVGLQAAALELADEILDYDPTAAEGEPILPPPAESKLPIILLVEDNDEFRFYLKDSLQAYYHIIEAANGKEGWQKALAGHPQLIVSDISMPYMDGIQLSQKIKADKRTNHIPVILLTAVNGEENQIKGLESGANDYLTKPFNFEILNAKIKNLLLYNRSLKDAYSKQIQVTGKEIEIESGDAKLLNSVVQYIDDKLNNPELSVEELAKHVGMSRGSLYHKLLELTGLTPIEYIRSVKLERAAALLEKSDYNVAQVAYMTGFGTPSYFSRLFKSWYNVLPSEYINAKRKDSRTRVDNGVS